MSYKFLADATAVSHITIIVALILGLLICFRYKRFRPWEAGALILVVLLWSYYGNCPLAILEQYLREKAGQVVNITTVGFLPYYANKLFGIAFSSHLVQRTTFFTGGALFAGSIEWLEPYVHVEIFRLRRSFRKSLKKFT